MNPESREAREIQDHADALDAIVEEHYERPQSGGGRSALAQIQRLLALHRNRERDALLEDTLELYMYEVEKNSLLAAFRCGYADGAADGWSQGYGCGVRDERAADKEYYQTREKMTQKRKSKNTNRRRERLKK